MKAHTILFFVLFSIVLSLSVRGQDTEKTDQDVKALVKQSEKLRKEDKILQADKLLLEANDIYPLGYHINEVAIIKAKSGDLNGANKLWDALFVSLKKYEVNHKHYNRLSIKDALGIYYYSQITNNSTYGNPELVVRISKDYLDAISGKSNIYIDGIIYSAAEYAFLTNDFESIKYFYQAARRFNSKFGIFATDIYMLLSDKKYDDAIVMLKDVNEKGADFAYAKYYSALMLCTIYELQGDYKSLEVLLRQAKSIPKNILISYQGSIAYHKKDYNDALSLFNEALKPYSMGWTTVEQANKYKHFTNRANVYVELKAYVNARKDYEAALVFNPQYKAALEGLAKLESVMVTEIHTDKIPPVILVTEPSSTRGLKITKSGEDIMIKGKATDASGIKTVTFNGIPVYAKEEGDFWGSVALKSGLNKIRIQVTDFAGNQAEEMVEVDRPVSPVAQVPIAAVTEKQGKNYAVFIASQNYADATIPSLENPVSDAIKLKLILKTSYNFADDNVFSLFNPQRDDFKKKFLELKEVLQPEDNLVIFYAGHGIWVDQEKKGYWLLTDAKRNDVNTWLPNKQVLDMIAELPSRHTLLITDACFSGSVFKSRSIGADAPAAIREMENKISRVAITSGNDTEVPDVSVFMKYLVKALSENKDKYLTAQKMFINQIIEAVMTESKTEPRYGTLELAGHVGGDFIFNKK